jgi:hypothetical protein
MNIAQLLHILAAIITIVIGAFAVISPKAAARFVGFGEGLSARGLSEVRSALGGAFVGVGIAPFVLDNANSGFIMLGIMYLAIGMVRSISIATLDRDMSRSNLISLASEWILAAILLLLR